MKATEFCKFFDFTLVKEDGWKEWDYSTAYEGNYHYVATDDQGTFHTRYFDALEELVDGFDSCHYDYIDSSAEEDGFEYDENNTEKAYYEQMLDWMQSREDYKDTGVCEIVACLVNPWMLEDDTEEIQYAV